MIRAITIALVLLALVACVRSHAVAPPTPAAPAAPAERPAARSAGGGPVAAPPAVPLALAPPAWPALDREPQLGVMMKRGPSLRVRLLVPHQLPDGHEVGSGMVDIVPTPGGGFRFGGRALAGPRVDLTPKGDGVTFAIDGVNCSGRLRVARVRDSIEVIEVVGMEAWLAGVLPAEMHPRWPVEALAAQAIVARSYAAARWQTRPDQAWQLMRGTADVAYDGAEPPSDAVATAIARTRGEILVHGGQAILARFHACSGGRTEDSSALWPDATLPDGRTPLARFMRPVDDPASIEGARGLNWTRTHQQWRAAFRVDELGERLGAWSRADRNRPRIGAVISVAIAGTSPSGRVARVAVTHRGTGGETTDTIDALDFRLAVGANQLRSLWWEKAVMASSRGGQFVVEGRGFGHGVGLPQVSAWWLANEGLRGEDIVSRYYPGTTIARMWR